jgi:hypothetical protein
MSAIALGMNLFLAVLLLAALFVGWRLERRLRGLRDSHTLFARAVGDLDGAVGRAQAGLSELREATDEAIDLLGGRLARAREASDRLEKAIADAERGASRVSERGPDPAFAPLRMGRAPEARPEARVTAGAEARTEALAPTNLKGLMELAELARPDTGIGIVKMPPRAPARPAFDDDLFEDVSKRA